MVIIKLLLPWLPFLFPPHQIIKGNVVKVGQFNEGKGGNVDVAVFHLLIVTVRTAEKERKVVLF